MNPELAILVLEPHLSNNESHIRDHTQTTQVNQRVETREVSNNTLPANIQVSRTHRLARCCLSTCDVLVNTSETSKFSSIVVENIWVRGSLIVQSLIAFSRTRISTAYNLVLVSVHVLNIKIEVKARATKVLVKKLRSRRRDATTLKSSNTYAPFALHSDSSRVATSTAALASITTSYKTKVNKTLRDDRVWLRAFEGYMRARLSSKHRAKLTEGAFGRLVVEWKVCTHHTTRRVRRIVSRASVYATVAGVDRVAWTVVQWNTAHIRHKWLDVASE
mmetsp:Transcript_4887/g.10115  ORF Transcript_4887/g.10115 Transcript_4887/m.10115 type:complete len:276 (-) Transcript_4887:1488-2315(-)